MSPKFLSFGTQVTHPDFHSAIHASMLAVSRKNSSCGTQDHGPMNGWKAGCLDPERWALKFDVSD